jgi:hypothetical protein
MQADSFFFHIGQTLSSSFSQPSPFVDPKTPHTQSSNATTRIEVISTKQTRQIISRMRLRVHLEEYERAGVQGGDLRRR